MLGKVRLVALSASLALASTLVGVAPPPASAAGCEQISLYTGRSPRADEYFTISSNSTCADLNVVRTASYTDFVSGQYYSRRSNRWINGSQGRVRTTTLDDGWDELILNVSNGTRVRGSVLYYGQFVVYAH